MGLSKSISTFYKSFTVNEISLDTFLQLQCFSIQQMHFVEVIDLKLVLYVDTNLLT